MSGGLTAGTGGVSSLATSIMTKITLIDGRESDFALWQARFTREAASAPGFASIEILPEFAGSAEWRIIQRFRDAAALGGWQASAERARLVAELDALRVHVGGINGESGDGDELAPDFHSLSCVTEVIASEVKPSHERDFQDWAAEVQAKQAMFPGYMGTLVQAPVSAALPYWTTLVRYSSQEQLEGWLGSSERKRLLERSDPAVSTWKSRRLSPFAGWFPAEPDRAPPAAYKQTMLVLLVLFPVVMLEIRFLSPLTSGLPGPVATFIGNAISVSLVSWPLMRIAIRGLGWWLQPAKEHRARTEMVGLATVIALYALEMIIFLRLP
jgi:antibiotic biosynthesis monooxygenase (ABM) superfamily enzyme